MISQVDRGKTTPVLGRTQYFFGFVVLTYKFTERKTQSNRERKKNAVMCKHQSKPSYRMHTFHIHRRTHQHEKDMYILHLESDMIFSFIRQLNRARDLLLQLN